jgi:hypothetical protein
VRINQYQSALFVGQASLLPVELRALCSCAGLFFAQIIDEYGEEIQVRVAALPRYFEADIVTFERHVQCVAMNYAQLDQMSEYERRFVGLATGDIIALVKAQAAQSRRRFAANIVLFQRRSEELDTSLPQNPHAEMKKKDTSDADTSKECESNDEREEEADLEPLARVFVSRSIVRDVFERLHITALRERRVHTAMLCAVLDSIELELERCRSWHERQALEKQAEEIKSVQSWRRQRRDSGYGWQRVVVAEEVMKNGSVAGWDMTVGKPVEQAA